MFELIFLSRIFKLVFLSKMSQPITLLKFLNLTSSLKCLNLTSSLKYMNLTPSLRWPSLRYLRLSLLRYQVLISLVPTVYLVQSSSKDLGSFLIFQSSFYSLGSSYSSSSSFSSFLTSSPTFLPLLLYHYIFCFLSSYKYSSLAFFSFFFFHQPPSSPTTPFIIAYYFFLLYPPTLLPPVFFYRRILLSFPSTSLPGRIFPGQPWRVGVRTPGNGLLLSIFLTPAPPPLVISVIFSSPVRSFCVCVYVWVSLLMLMASVFSSYCSRVLEFQVLLEISSGCFL